MHFHVMYFDKDSSLVILAAGNASIYGAARTALNASVFLGLKLC